MLIKTDKSIIQSYLEDSSNISGGYAECVAFPENTEEAAEFIKDCNNKKIPITIAGAGYGTVGGRIPFGGTVLSTEKMNKIIEINDDYARVQSGVSLDALNKELDHRARWYPVDPTEYNATLGGNCATNASGARSLKYGPTRNYVNALKVILATGEILDIKRGEKAPQDILPSYIMPKVKNAAGYYTHDNMDLIDLFIGQEGTLGFIAEIELKLLLKPKDISGGLAFFKTFNDAWDFVREAKKELKPLSLEYLDKRALGLAAEKFPNLPRPTDQAIMFETEGALLDEYVELLGKCGALVDDTFLAQSKQEKLLLKEWRHAIPLAISDILKQRKVIKVSTDFALPDDKFLDFVNFSRELLNKEKFEYLIFGHIGSCHLHINILLKEEREMEKAKPVYLQMMKKVISSGGTISAEHGIGKLKCEYLKLMYGEEGISEMRALKKHFDPNFILGRDNIFSPRSCYSPGRLITVPGV